MSKKYLIKSDLTSKTIVIRSNDLLITGEGGSDWDGSIGNIVLYNLKTKKFAKGAKISTFWYAILSPSKKYILYEHGSDSNNNVDFYDIATDRNYPISSYFRFKDIFPGIEYIDEAPVGWVDENKFLASVYLNEEDQYLALFDIANRAIQSL